MTDQIGWRRSLWALALMFIAVSACATGHGAQTSSTRPTLPASITTMRTPATITVPVIVELPTPTIREAFRRSVALVRITACDGGASGSGFFVSPTMLITNYHVVEGATSVRVQTVDGTVLDALTVERHASADLARVTVRVSNAQVAAIETAAPEPGDHVHVVGFPRGGPVTMTEGRLVDYPPDDVNEPTMELSAVVEPGNSGGPVFNDSGRVIGVATAVQLRTGIALTIPASELVSDRARWTVEPMVRC